MLEKHGPLIYDSLLYVNYLSNIWLEIYGPRLIYDSLLYVNSKLVGYKSWWVKFGINESC